MPAFVSIRNGPFRDVSRATLRRWAERMLAALDLADAELSVAMTDDSEIRELNKVFRHRDKATDVLAFAMREGEPVGAPASPNRREPQTRKSPPTTSGRTGSRSTNVARDAEILGDVVVSVETARRQAKQHRRALDAEVCMLLAHGLLHLVGYDHGNDREEAVMTKETRRLCRTAFRAPKTGTSKDRKSKRAGSKV